MPTRFEFSASSPPPLMTKLLKTSLLKTSLLKPIPRELLNPGSGVCPSKGQGSNDKGRM
jgi:hypothetical protein